MEMIFSDAVFYTSLPPLRYAITEKNSRMALFSSLVFGTYGRCFSRSRRNQQHAHTGYDAECFSGGLTAANT